MTSNGVTAVTLRYYADFKANYVKVVEGRPIVSATKMWPKESGNI